MKLFRRQFLHLAAGAAALPALSRNAHAQSYPTRPVRLIVGFPAGGGVDIVGRLMGHWLSERLGEPFIIENRPGAGTNIATEAVVRAAPDGHTLLVAATPNAINATLYDNLNFNFIRDIAPVASIGRTPLILVISPSFPAKTVPEFIAYAKANPGKISYASSGIGTPIHIAAEMFKMATGIDMVHVPYRGTMLALPDLFAGRVQMMFADMSVIEHIKDGKLRALAVTTLTRSAALPDVPVVGDFVAGYEASGWQGIGAPKNTPVEIIDKLHKEISSGLADSDVEARLTEIGYSVLAGSTADFGQLIAENTEKWGKVIRAANIKPA
jgi:tripartite-type tricarboxylate transporter receptor subunit TctC